MLTCKAIGWALIGVVSGSLFPGPVQGADPVYTSWRLGAIQVKDLFHPGGMQTRGSLTIDELRHDALGGFVRMTAKRPTQCPPGTGLPQGGEIQRFKYTWRFESDVSRMSASRGPVTLWFTIEGDRGTGCMDQNPPMDLRADGDPMSGTPSFHPTSFCFKPANWCDQGPRTIRIRPDRPESWRKDARFEINIWDFRHDAGGFQLVITYPYVGESAAAPVPPTDPHSRDLVARAGRDGRFGAAIAGSAGALLNWAPNWQLRWLDFQFSGGRVVRIFLATSTANPAIRYTIYWDPDTGQWRNWEQAS